MDLSHIHNQPLDPERAAIAADAFYYTADFCYKSGRIADAYLPLIQAIDLYKGILAEIHGQLSDDTKRGEIETRLEYARAFIDELDTCLEGILSKKRGDGVLSGCSNDDTLRMMYIITLVDQNVLQ
tara:strand:- start:582 stop:959 length:378 start_codon:yes stop_codon:yes gene_type:complete